MRDFKGMKRQRGRNRGGGGGGGGGGKPQHNANRAFDSNGPDGVKIRGAAQHVYEKYQQLARDASSSGDRVLAENYLQHAEHYFRVLRAMQPQRPIAEIVGRDQFVSGYDIDFEDESGAAAAEAAESDAEGENGEGDQPRGERPERQDRYEGRDRQREDRPRDDRQRDDRQRDDYRSRDRDDRQRDDRQRDDRPRDDRPRDDRSRDDRPREERYRDRNRNFRDDRPRDDRPREDRQRDDRPAREDRGPRQDQPRGDRDPLGVIEPEATPLTAPRESAPRESAPREPAPARVLRAEDGDVSHAPAFLQARPAAEASDEPAGETKRPRRRRAPRSFEGDAAAPATADADEG
ncbi:MAG: DUF4167 domain-containing protein [Proteobacteria bacterium]|nr:DUF4167 domain-containing protein [Pseudomonadota bacterium]